MPSLPLSYGDAFPPLLGDLLSAFAAACRGKRVEGACRQVGGSAWRGCPCCCCGALSGRRAHASETHRCRCRLTLVTRGQRLAAEFASQFDDLRALLCDSKSESASDSLRSLVRNPVIKSKRARSCALWQVFRLDFSEYYASK
jgi:hypothetical protein